MKAFSVKFIRQLIGLSLLVACLTCGFLTWSPRRALGVDVPAPSSPVEVRHSFPESGKAWENSLGMKFVPVPGAQVLFSIWDTREQDYLAFLADEHPDWELPADPQSRMCPVVKVSWQDATDFCGWLTEKERLQGKLDKDQGYRLPTDAEWSRAVGLPEESGSTPEQKSGKIKDIYPWGSEWPPPQKAGNYSNQAVKDFVSKNVSKKQASVGQTPDFAPVLPVAAFAPNRYGLYDMGGNVWQWCEDWYDDSRKLRVLRGASALVTGPDFLLSSVRGYDPPGVLHAYNGFRCVLSFDASAPRAPERATAPRPIPIFRIEPGMHTAPIRRVSVDAAGSLALTVSQDKTARLWELPGGRLLRVLNPPQDKVSEGELSAAALSPDGTLAAVGGGQTGFPWDKSDSIYIFNTATGRLVRRFPSLPIMIHDLAFSAQGRFLAATLGAGNGLRVWEMATGREVGQDTDYGGELSNSVDWHGEERLVTSCLDGQLRLYQLAAGAGESRLTLLKKRAVRGGSKRLCNARFSPDGRLIAVGFANDFGFNFSRAVAVVDGSDLAFRFAPDTAGVKDGDLGSIAWTDDGTGLVAGGMWESNDGMPIRRWPELGRGHPSDAVSALKTILDLKPLPGGRILFGTADPAWGVLASNGQRQLFVSPPIANYSGLLEGFQLSDDGATVSFAYEKLGQARARFALPGRKLTLFDDAAATSGLHPPLTEGLPVTDWKNSTGTRLFGQPLPLAPLEASRSLAIAADARFFLLGTDENLWSIWTWGRATPWITKKFAHPTLFGQHWRMPVPGQVCAVNLADGDRLAVAAYADGTIRWHRADNGKELLALFPHADRKRWVLWTPEGYYDASPGAEDLIGWHLNRGKDQAADFFPVSRFRAVYYRPDVISRVLRTLDNPEALRQANAALGRPVASSESIQEVIARLSPPVVELTTGGVLGEVTVPRDARSVAVHYLVRQTGQEAPTGVSVRLNGRPVDVTAPLLPEGQEAAVEVPLPGGAEGEVSVIAEHRYGASEAAILRVRRESGAPPARKPDLYVIACGVAHLQANEPRKTDAGLASSTDQNDKGVEVEVAPAFSDLQFAGDDARKFADLFLAQDGKAYGHVMPTVLVDKQATVSAIIRALDEVQRQAQTGDVVVFFFSGHGYFTPESGYLLITHETQVQNLAPTALAGNELARRLASVRGSVVLALDTCQAGGYGADRQIRPITGPGDLTGLVNQLSSSEQGVVVISSSAEDQSSFEDEDDKQGIFTKAIAEGLTGGAAQNGQITCISLQNWIIKRVPELVKKLDPTAVQSPACVLPKGVPDFTLAIP